MKTLVMNSIALKILILTVTNIIFYLYITAIKIGILNVMEFITNIFILFKYFLQSLFSFQFFKFTCIGTCTIFGENKKKAIGMH